jgi:hypothetical protein
LAFRQYGKPPLAPCVALSFITADEVALADHANRRPALIEDGNRADMVLKQKLSDIPNRRILSRRDNCARHHVASLHGFSLQPSRQTSNP